MADKLQSDDNSVLEQNQANTNDDDSTHVEADTSIEDEMVVLNRLSQIQAYKQQVLDMMDRMEKEDPEVDSETAQKLRNSFENFNDQEKQYLNILQNIKSFKTRQKNTEESPKLNTIEESPQASSVATLPRLLLNRDDVISVQKTVDEKAASLSSKFNELEGLRQRLAHINSLAERTEQVDDLENELLATERRMQERAVKRNSAATNERQIEDDVDKDNEGSTESIEIVETVDELVENNDNKPNQEAIKSKLEQKFGELMATQKRIAEIRSMMNVLEQKSSDMQQSSSSRTLPAPSIRIKNHISPAKPSNRSNELHIRPIDLNEQRQHLNTIKHEMMEMNDEQLAKFCNRRRVDENTENSSGIQTETLVSEDEDIASELHEATTRSAKYVETTVLNNSTLNRRETLENGSNVTDTFDDDHISDLLTHQISDNRKRFPTNIQNNPRLPSFRRNNDISSSSNNSNNHHIYSNNGNGFGGECVNQRPRSLETNRQGCRRSFNDDNCRKNICPSMSNNYAPTSNLQYASSNVSCRSTATDDGCGGGGGSGYRASSGPANRPSTADARLHQLSRHIDGIRSLFNSLRCGNDDCQDRSSIDNQFESTLNTNDDTVALLLGALKERVAPSANDRVLNMSRSVYASLPSHYSSANASVYAQPLSHLPPTTMAQHDEEKHKLAMQLISCQQQLLDQQRQTLLLRQAYENLTTSSMAQREDVSLQNANVELAKILFSNNAPHQRDALLNTDDTFKREHVRPISAAKSEHSLNVARKHLIPNSALVNPIMCSQSFSVRDNVRSRNVEEFLQNLQALDAENQTDHTFNNKIRDILGRYLMNNDIQTGSGIPKVDASSNSFNYSNSKFQTKKFDVENKRQVFESDKSEDSSTPRHGARRKFVQSKLKRDCRSASVIVVRRPKSRLRSKASKPTGRTSDRSFSRPRSSVAEFEELDQKFKADLTSFLRETDQSTRCDGEFLNFVKKFILASVLSYNAMPDRKDCVFFYKKLSSNLVECLASFQGLVLAQCIDDLLESVLDKLNENLAFYKLFQSMDERVGCNFSTVESNNKTIESASSMCNQTLISSSNVYCQMSKNLNDDDQSTDQLTFIDEHVHNHR